MSRAVRVLPVPADIAWNLVADARHHARWIPLTRVEANGPVRVGTRIRATSGPGARHGAPGFVDRMEVVRADPPGPTRVAVYLKHGPVLLGQARIEVTAVDERHTRVIWSENTYLAHFPQALGRVLLGPFLTFMIGHALKGAAREVAGSSGAGSSGASRSSSRGGRGRTARTAARESQP